MLKFLRVVLEQEQGFRSVVAGLAGEGACAGRAEERAAAAVEAAVGRGVLSGLRLGRGGAGHIECALLPPFEGSGVWVAVPEGLYAGLGAAQRNGCRWLYAYALLDQLWESHLARCLDVKKTNRIITQKQILNNKFSHNTISFSLFLKTHIIVQCEGRPAGTLWTVHACCAEARPRDLRGRHRVAQRRPRRDPREERVCVGRR